MTDQELPVARWERALIPFTLGVALLWLTGLLRLPLIRLTDYLSDDAFYYLKVARHLAQGMGPTFDGITVTTGFHPLFAFVLAGLQRILPEDPLTPVRAMLLLNSLSFLGTGLLIFQTVRDSVSRRAARWAAALWFCNPHALLLVSTGMEGSLYALMLAAYFRIAVHPSPLSWRKTLGMAVICGLAIVTRTDALALMVLTLAWFALPVFHDLLHTRPFPFAAARRQLGLGLLFAGVALIPFVLWLHFAYTHTGNWLQASAQMKSLWRAEAVEGMGPLREILFSLDLLVTWIVKSVVKVPFFKYALIFCGFTFVLIQKRPFRILFDWNRIFWLFPLALGLAYSFKFPRAWTWYYAPGLVTLTLLSAQALPSAFRARRQSGLRGRVARLLPLILLLCLVESYAFLATKSARGRNRKQEEMVRVAEWIAEHVPETVRMGTWNSGIFGWIGDRNVINLDGLINNEIAPWIRDGGSESAYIREREIEVLVEYRKYLDRSLPHWREGQHYRLLHLHPGEYNDPIEVWEVLSAPEE